MFNKAVLPLTALALATMIAAAPSAPSHRESFLPPNDLKIPVGAYGDKSISRAQFDAVMDRIQALYGPVVAARGGRLVINRLWDDETVNASAQRQGRNWVLNMYGGLARHPAITQDGMALVACHELGHHLGGAPKYGGGNWASNEGEADYFANTKCLHRVFADSASNVFTRMNADDDIARTACGESYKNAGERAVCVRSAAAGMSVTELFRALRRQDAQPHYDTPDTNEVTEMYDGHPDTQCRLDTYFQGSLCTKSFKTDMSETDPAVGGCVASQGYKTGLRPRCWYLPPASEPVMSGPSPVASMERQSRAAASPILASLKSSDPFSGL